MTEQTIADFLQWADDEGYTERNTLQLRALIPEYLQYLKDNEDD